jgi:hypothetical protein
MEDHMKDTWAIMSRAEPHGEWQAWDIRLSKYSTEEEANEVVAKIRSGNPDREWKAERGVWLTNEERVNRNP